MSESKWPTSLIRFVFDLDAGGQARLRRGADAAALFLLPGLATLLQRLDGPQLEDALLTARIAAILGSLGKDASSHPAAALARADLDPRRMGRLLTSEPEVLPERLVTVARFLVAKRERAGVVPFHWLMAEMRTGTTTRNRAEWARKFGEELAQPAKANHDKGHKK
jgi:hypothetical protein